MYSTRRSKIRKGELGLQTPGIQHQTGLPGSQTVRETLGLKGLRNQSGSRQASRFWEEFLQDGWNDRAPTQVRIYGEELYTNEGSLGSGFIFLFLKKKEKGERWGNNDLQGRQNSRKKGLASFQQDWDTKAPLQSQWRQGNWSIQNYPGMSKGGSKRVDGGRQPNSLLPEKEVERQDQTLKINYAVM